MNPIMSPHEFIKLPTYWVIMSLSYCVGLIFFYRRSLEKNLSIKILSEISFLILFFGTLGARLFHVIFEYPDYYLEEPLSIFKVWNGGFVFYGGFTFSFLAVLIYLKKIQQNIPRWLDAFAPALSLTYALGRIGCLMAGCCYGKSCNLPWAITFPANVEAPSFTPLHPTQVYSSISEFLILGTLLLLEKKGNLKSGGLFYSWMVLHGVSRILVEQFRGDFRGFELLGISISSTMSIFLIFIGIFLLKPATFWQQSKEN